eukprot:2074334-Pyramimonas_sp.AAC.1
MRSEDRAASPMHRRCIGVENIGPHIEPHRRCIVAAPGMRRDPPTPSTPSPSGRPRKTDTTTP